MRHLRLAALVLAAGAGERYSPRPGAKLLADLEGRPLLEHALETVRTFEPEATVVVLGHGADDIERAVDWAAEQRAVNPHPERGIGSSLVVGIRVLVGHGEGYDGAFIVLGDQPRLRVSVMRALADAAARARPADRPLIVPRYADDPGPRNPVLLLRPAWLLLDDLPADQGLASLIESRPDMVLELPVGGTMPDVDQPEDLDRLRLGAGT